MTVIVEPGTTFTATLVGADPGMSSVLGATIDRGNEVIVSRSTLNLAEDTGTPGTYTVTLTAPELPGNYMILWDNDDVPPGVATEALIVTGEPLCSLAQIDAQLSRGQAGSAYTDDQKRAARDVATTAFEREAGVAFTPRSDTVTVRRCGAYVDLPSSRVLTVVSASADGVDLTPEALASVYVTSDAVYGLGYYSTPLTITYLHGYAETPPDVSRAVATLTASLLKDGPFDDRGYGVTDDGASFRLLTAGVAGSSFSIPEVQAALIRYRQVFGL